MIKTASSLLPLCLEIERSRVKQLVNHLKNPKEFWTRYPIPSVAIDEPKFGPLTYSRHLWRGTVWLNHNWIIHYGLHLHGYTEIAKELFIKTEKLLRDKGFCEFYDPFTGNPGFAARRFTWGALILDMLELPTNIG